MNTMTKTDDEAVKQAVLDYVEGVYETDPTRIERSVHPDLAKRGFFVNEEGATESIMSFAAFIEHTKTYNKDGQFPPDAPKEIIIHEILDHTAACVGGDRRSAAGTGFSFARCRSQAEHRLHDGGRYGLRRPFLLRAARIPHA